jgi:hypothetical protein
MRSPRRWQCHVSCAQAASYLGAARDWFTKHIITNAIRDTYCSANRSSRPRGSAGNDMTYLYLSGRLRLDAGTRVSSSSSSFRSAESRRSLIIQSTSQRKRTSFRSAFAAVSFSGLRDRRRTIGSGVRQRQASDGLLEESPLSRCGWRKRQTTASFRSTDANARSLTHAFRLLPASRHLLKLPAADLTVPRRRRCRLTRDKSHSFACPSVRPSVRCNVT